MNPPIEAAAVAHGIQLAVAPVFLLTAVVAMIGVAANRLARIIDRARQLEQLQQETRAGTDYSALTHELGTLRTRGLLANITIGLLTLCAFSIGATVIILFLAETTDLPMLRLSMFSFLGGLVFFMLALACFFVETMIARRLLNFGIDRPQKKAPSPNA